MIKNKIGVVVFYDGNYLGRVSKYYSSNNIVNYRFNIDVLHAHIINKAREIAENQSSDIYISAVRYYRSRHTAQEAQHRKNQLYRDRVNDDLLRSLNIDCRYVSYSTDFNSGDDSYIYNWLSLELMETVAEKKTDLVVLVGGSSSYLPLIQILRSKGIDIMFVGWDAAMQGDTAPDIKSCEALFEKADYSVMVNSVLDSEPEQLEGLLTAVNSVIIEEEETEQIEKNSLSDEIIGEWEVSEIVTLKATYGFIRFPNNNLFFRSSDFKGEFSKLKVGESVEFMVGKTPEGQLLAKNVSKIESNLPLFDEEEDYSVSEEEIDWDDNTTI